MLFGTVEFFEKEIFNYLNENLLNGISENPLSVITSELKYEISHDFIFDERIRLECIKNLKYAIDKITQSQLISVRQVIL